MTQNYLHYLGSASHVYALMSRFGWTTRITPRLLDAACTIAAGSTNWNLQIEEVRRFFRAEALMQPAGLETIPSCWLRDIPRILVGSLKPHWVFVPYMITDMRLSEGALSLSFAQESPVVTDRLTCWDQLRILLNRSLRPNLWESLNRSEELEIWNVWPSLRSELLRVRY